MGSGDRHFRVFEKRGLFVSVAVESKSQLNVEVEMGCDLLQQTIFDNNYQRGEPGITVVICFQQTIFDNHFIFFCKHHWVVICFQQTIFDN